MPLMTELFLNNEKEINFNVFDLILLFLILCLESEFLFLKNLIKISFCFTILLKVLLIFPISFISLYDK